MIPMSFERAFDVEHGFQREVRARYTRALN